MVTHTCAVHDEILVFITYVTGGGLASCNSVKCQTKRWALTFKERPRICDSPFIRTLRLMCVFIRHTDYLVGLGMHCRIYI